MVGCAVWLLVGATAVAVAEPPPVGTGALASEESQTLRSHLYELRKQDNAAALQFAEAVLRRIDRAHSRRSAEAIAWRLELSYVHTNSGTLDRAVEVLRQAAADARVLYADQPDELRSLAFQLQSLGALADAEQAYRWILARKEAKNGPSAPELQSELDELATVRVRQGALDDAIALRQRAIALLEPADVYFRWGLINHLQRLAEIHAYRGSFHVAEPLIRTALDLTRSGNRGANAGTAVPGPSVPGDLRSAGALRTLAGLLDLTGQAEEARDLRRHALRLIEENEFYGDQSLPPMLGQVARDLASTGALELAEALGRRRLGFFLEQPLAHRDLAAIAVQRGDWTVAEAELRIALQLSETTWGTPGYLEVLFDLGTLYARIGEPARAEGFFRRVLQIMGPLVKQGNAIAMEPLARLGEVAAARGRTGEAHARYAQAFAISEDLLGSLRFVSGEARLAALLESLDGAQDQIWSLVAEHPTHAGLAELGAAVAFLRKGRSLDERAAVGRSLRGGGDPRVSAQLDELRRLQDRYAAVAFSGDIASATQAAALQRTIADAERELARRSAAFRAEQLPDPSRIVGEIAGRLGTDQVLIEIVAYRAYRFAPSVGVSPWLGSRYLAFVVGPGGRVTAYPLGDADSVDGAARALLERIADRNAPADDPALLGAARAAFDRVLAPLASELAGKTRVVLSLDGALQMVPFAAMRDARGWLLEQYAFEYVSSGRDLLPQPAAPASGIEVLAAPDFSRVGESAARFGLRNVTPLPATVDEAEVIARMTGASPRTGAAATEDTLLAIARPRVLHIATHGVFLDDAPIGDGAGLRGVSLVEIGEQPAAPPDNPLLRSALILAPASGATASTRDGIVTALEVSRMDLRGTQLVVLSACETGLGELRKGQGVYGLRRAFLIAGAETLVTSLWRVSDTATLELMTGFYGQLATGVSRVEAMHRASRAVRVERPHPFYWAPFVVVGRDGPVALPKPGR